VGCILAQLMIEWTDGSICGEKLMSGVIAYFFMLGGATGVALGLFFGLKAVKLI
jgi:hypothetical protein